MIPDAGTRLVAVDPLLPEVRRPRILMTGMSWFADQPGGLDRYFEALLDGLRGQGCGVDAVAAGTPRVRADERGVPSSDLRRKLVGFRRAARTLGDDCDLVDAHFALHAAAALSSRVVRGRPLVVHFQGPWSQESAMEGAGRGVVQAKHALEGQVYRRASACVVLCASFGEMLVRDLGVDPAKVHVLPPGVDLERFALGDRVEARRALALDPDRPTLLTVRRLVHRTGVDRLLAALPAVLRRVPDVQLVVAGDGGQRAALEQLAEGMGLHGIVRFLGRVADDVLPVLYRAADVSVVPSRALEGFGLVTLESFASGTPVVVTDVDGLADAPRALDPSCVVPPDDEGALAERLASALTGAAPLADAARCREAAEAHGWDRVARRHLGLYDRVLSA